MESVISVILNALIVIFTVLCVGRDVIGTDGKRDLRAFRYYTILSNLFGALACAVMLLFTALRKVPLWVYVLKFTSAVCLSVTFVTVCVFLAPHFGWKAMFSGWNFCLHLAGPVMAWTAFCLFEKGAPIRGALWLYGLVPVLAYGLVYAYMVLVRTEDRGGWPDFYGFNRGGHWKLSFAAMITGGALLSLLTAAVHNL